jgi:hypothetical protein
VYQLRHTADVVSTMHTSCAAASQHSCYCVWCNIWYVSVAWCLQEELVYQVRHTAGLNPKAFQARYTRAGPTYGAGLTAVKPLKPLQNWLLQVRTCPHIDTSWWWLAGCSCCACL